MPFISEFNIWLASWINAIPPVTWMYGGIVWCVFYCLYICIGGGLAFCAGYAIVTIYMDLRNWLQNNIN